MKERNSMFDSKNPVAQEIEQNSKFIMVKPNQFCSQNDEILSQKTMHKSKTS
jgi:hypothetical protein